MAIQYLTNASVMGPDGNVDAGRTLAIEGGRIAAILSELPSAEGSASILDLAGRIVLPGFGDAHLHVSHWGRRLSEPPLGEARTAAELLAMLAAYYQEHPDASGIHVGGFNEEQWTDHGLPDASDLDRIAADIPVVVGRICVHKGIVNTYVLDQLQEQLSSPEYAPYAERNSSGELTGRLTENAWFLAMNLPRADQLQELKSALAAGLRDLVRRGYAAAASQDITSPDEELFWQALEEVYREEAGLPLYIAQVGASSIEELDRWPLLRERFKEYEKIRIGPLKLFKDGSLGARTALLSEPYADDPSTSGMSLIPFEEQIQWFVEAERRGIQVITHAIGDLAAAETCSAYLEAAGRSGSSGNPLRHAIVHAQITRPETVMKIHQSGLGVITQPMFIPSDREMAPLRVGKDVYRSSYAFAEFARLGVPQAFSSDAPVETADPWLSLAQLSDLGAGERVGGYTKGFAHMNHLEGRMGAIVPGMDATFTVLDLKDPAYLGDTEKLQRMHAALVMLQGEILEHKLDQ